MEKIYVTEPQASNLTLVRQLLPEHELVEGTPAFDGEHADCTALLIRSATAVTATIRESFPQLKHVIRIGTGVDNIDLDFCSQQGIAVYNAPGANADAVSDYVVALMFYALRNLQLLDDERVAAWNRFAFTGHSMASRRIGIIGFGHIGRQVFTKLQGFGCRAFTAYDPLLTAADMPKGVTYAASVEEVLQASDIVTLHVPLLPATQYLIGAHNLGLLPEGAILMNASRGGIVNEAELLAFLGGHHLTYIADTVENEPKVNPALLSAPSVIITPHIASLTTESNDQMVETAIHNFLERKPLNQPSV